MTSTAWIENPKIASLICSVIPASHFFHSTETRWQSLKGKRPAATLAQEKLLYVEEAFISTSQRFQKILSHENVRVMFFTPGKDALLLVLGDMTSKQYPIIELVQLWLKSNYLHWAMHCSYWVLCARGHKLVVSLLVPEFFFRQCSHFTYFFVWCRLH